MNTEVRTSVWEGRVEADRLHRYYGKLAGKLTRRDRLMSVVICLLALLTAGLASIGHGWTLPAAFLTAVAGTLPLVYRLGEPITDAAYCAKRLRDISIGWQELWHEVYGLQPDEVVDDRVVARWRELAAEMNEVTVLKERVPEDKKLLGATQKEAHAYWKEKSAQAAGTAVARA